ncbi:beta strand repeat-containing protein [Bacteroidota bacterium]
MRKFFQILIILLLTATLSSAQTYFYDFGTRTAPFTPITSYWPTSGTNPSSLFASPSPGTFFYGLTFNTGGSISALNAGNYAVGSQTEIVAQAASGSSNSDYVKFGITNYTTSNDEESYIRFEIVLAGNTGTNTSDAGVWYFTVGDARYSSRFLRDNTTTFNDYTSVILIRWTFGTSGSIQMDYWDNTINDWASLTSDLKQGVKYDMQFFINGKNNTQSYDKNGVTNTVAKKYTDIWIDNLLVGDDVNNANPMDRTLKRLDGFGFFGNTSNQAYIFLDDIQYGLNCNNSSWTEYYSKSTGNLNSTSSWGTSTDGSGTSPSSFTANQCYYYVRNNASPTINGNWTVSGNGSRVIVGDSTNACNFTIPSTYTYTGDIDLHNNATLTLQNATAPTFNVIGAGSTVIYDKAGSQDISYPRFYNLKSTNTGTKTLVMNVTATNLVTVGDDVNTGTLLVPGSYTLTGTADVKRHGTLEIANSTAPTLGTLYDGSTVKYSASSAQATPAADPSYYNLDISNSSGVSLGTSTEVRGNLLLASGAFSIGANTLTLDSVITKTSGSLTGGSTSNIIAAANTLAGKLTLPAISGNLNNLTAARAAGVDMGANLTIGGDLLSSAGAFSIGAYTLTLGNTLTMSGGSLTGGSSSNLIVAVNGTAGSVTLPSISGNLNNLTANRAAGTILGADLTVYNTLSLSNGALSIAANTLTLDKTLTIGSGGSITGGSTSNLSITSATAAKFTIPAISGNLNNLTINRASGADMGSNLTVGGDLLLSSGAFSIKAYTLTLGNSLTKTSGSLTGGTTSSLVVAANASAGSVTLPAISGNLGNLTTARAAGVNMGASLTVATALTLTDGALSIGGNTLTLSGSLSAATGTLTGGATSNLTINGTASKLTIPAISGNLNNFTIARANGVDMSTDLTVGGTLALTSGALSIKANTLTLDGALTKTGGSLTGGSTSNLLITSATASKLTLPAISGNLNNLTISRTNGVDMGAALAVGGDLLLSSGVFSIKAYTLTLGNSLSLSGGSLTGGASSNLTVAANASAAKVILPAISGNLHTLTVARANGVDIGEDLSTTNTSISAGGVLNIPEGKTLTVTGTLSNANGTSAEHLYVKSSAAGTGNLISSTPEIYGTVERYMVGNPTLRPYHYFSSPINNGSYNDIWTSGDFNIYWYDETQVDPSLNGGWTRITGGTMTNGKGYSLLSNYASRTISVDGVLNAATLSPSVSYTTTTGWTIDPQGWNLIGNPFPCAVSAPSFITDNAADLDLQAIYYWDDANGDITQSDDYSTRTITTGTAGSGAASGVPGVAIPVAQGFFVKVKSSVTSLDFNTSQKIANSSTQFFIPDFVENLWIAVNGPNQAYNEIAFSFLEGATKKFEPELDALKLRGNPNIALYSYVEDLQEQYVIQGRPAFLDMDIIPLGINAGKDGEYSFYVKRRENFSTAIPVSILDLETGEVHPIDENGMFTIYLTSGEYNERFVLQLGSYAISINSNIETEESENIHTYTLGSDIYFDNRLSKPGRLSVYNPLGQLLKEVDVKDNASLMVSIPDYKGVVVVSFISEEARITRKLYLD